ncbi:ABC transporter ATP-binding protein [Pseudonocardia sp. KRD291]|uniref:ABC transporter ATP-binding protein n=1 Tax=Pseudonocardia sp. KRD291 TaxID=2792007 RepID=UPI001C49F707|nr:ABC transporter ATP-binding protein [Pseudonocardia sp. KRD291]MBW0104664.1 ABC transporter ATP-binding protein [Pseudonocardia sp. KRD291]
MSATTTARVTGLVREFSGRRVLDGLDLTVGDGEFVALLGRSGSGKSTLLRVLAGLDDTAGDGVSGDIRVPGSVSMAFQEPRLLPWRSVRDNVVLGLDRPDAAEVVDRSLAEVGLDGHAQAWPLTLSGGEAQRASLARALVREPDLLLLDEPFGALDALTRIAMHRLVLDLWERHRPGILLVTHDVDEALLLADRVLVLAEGAIVAEHSPGVRPRSTERVADLRRAVLSELGVADDAA